jgi:hypothetical protein
MCEERKSRKGDVLFWAAMCVMPLTILSSGHGRLQHFFTGFAAAIFVVGLVEMVRQRRSCVSIRRG